MEKYSILFIFILFIAILPIMIYIKVRSLGLTRVKSVFILFTFPLIVPSVHINVYKDIKVHNRKRAYRILFMPITHLPMVITAYAKSAVSAEAKYQAIKEMIPTLSRQELNKLEEILKEEGLKIKLKNGKLKSIKVMEKEQKKERKDIPRKVVDDKFLWGGIFSQEVKTNIKRDVCYA